MHRQNFCSAVCRVLLHLSDVSIKLNKHHRDRLCIRWRGVAWKLARYGNRWLEVLICYYYNYRGERTNMNVLQKEQQVKPAVKPNSLAPRILSGSIGSIISGTWCPISPHLSAFTSLVTLSPAICFHFGFIVALAVTPLEVVKIRQQSSVLSSDVNTTSCENKSSPTKIQAKALHRGRGTMKSDGTARAVRDPWWLVYSDFRSPLGFF